MSIPTARKHLSSDDPTFFMSRPVLPGAFAGFALIIGLAILPLTVDVPSDGPYRAMLAYNWFRRPYVALCGTWLPGPMYLNGLFYAVVGDPLFSTRIFNLIAGAMAVPVCYLLWERLFGPLVALLAATALLCLPLRIGLSASGMTEAGFLLEFMAGTWLLMVAAEPHRSRYACLAGALAMLALAGMSRYEAWLLMPLLPVYYFFRTRRLHEALAVVALLSVFPALWMLGNQHCFGDALKGFRAATTEERYAENVDLAESLLLLGSRMIQQAGMLLPFCIAAGALAAIQGTRARWQRLRAEPDRLLYAALVAVTWAVLVKFTMARGPATFQSRYMLLALVLALPFAGLPLRSVARRRPRTTIWVMLSFIATLAAAGRSIYATWLPDIGLVARQPGDVLDEMADVAAWLTANGYTSVAILTTPIKVADGWAANYLPLFIPGQSHRIKTASYWISDEDIRKFVREDHPELLIAGAAEIDREETGRLERLLHLDLRPADIVFSKQGRTAITIYRIAAR